MCGTSGRPSLCATRRSGLSSALVISLRTSNITAKRNLQQNVAREDNVFQMGPFLPPRFTFCFLLPAEQNRALRLEEKKVFFFLLTGT